MKSDLYTKIILTVIAVNLTVLTFMKLDIVPKVNATGTGETSYPAEVKYGLVPLNEDGSITVKLANSDELDVNITGISTGDNLNVAIKEVDTWDKMNVTIKKIDTRDNINVNLEEVESDAFNYCTVPVRIEQ